MTYSLKWVTAVSHPSAGPVFVGVSCWDGHGQPGADHSRDGLRCHRRGKTAPRILERKMDSWDLEWKLWLTS